MGEYKAVLEDPRELERLVYSARSCWEQYLIVDGSLHNDVCGDAITGCTLAIRTCWYRSMAVTLIRRLEVRIDGELIPQEDIYFQVEGNPHTYRLDEIGPKQSEEYWYLNKYGFLHLRKPGGLTPGPHMVEVFLEVFVTYHNYPDATYQKKILIVD